MLKALTRLQGVSGREWEVGAFIAQRLDAMGRRYVIDKLGNIMVGGGSLLFTAHMDEPGLVVYDADENGFLQFKQVGDFDDKYLLGRKVEIGPRKVPGVVGFSPYHMMRISNQWKEKSAADRHICIGASTREQALTAVSPGDYAAVSRELRPLGGDRHSGKALPSRMGCAALLELLAARPEGEYTAAFTVQKRIGQKGIKTVVHRLEPELVVSLDAAGCLDVPGGGGGSLRLGEGPVLPLADGQCTYDGDWIEAFRRMAEKGGIKTQFQAKAEGASEAGSAASAAGGARAVSLLIPCRGPDSPAGVMSMFDLNETVRLLALIADRGGNVR